MNVRMTAFVLALCLVGGMLACYTPRTLDDQARSLLEGQPIKGKVTALDTGLERALEIASIELVAEGGVKTLLLGLRNLKTSDIRLEYSVRFFAGSRPVEGINVNWIPLMILRRDAAFIKTVLSRDDVDGFELVVQIGGRNEN